MNASSDRTNGNPLAGNHADPAAMKLLLVDDNQSVRRAASEFLSKAGYIVVTAVDGFDALAKVVEHRPALVFVDIMMPKLDGYQTCALIKNNAQYRNIPVVLLTSNDGLFDKARARVVRSDARLAKPFSEGSLIAAVKKHTEKGQLASGASSVRRQSVENSDA